MHSVDDRRRAAIQDAAIALCVGAVWFGGVAIARSYGWSPIVPESYVVCGAFIVFAVGLRRAAPMVGLVAVGIAYPLFYGVPIQTELHLIPILVGGYGATSTGRVRTIPALIVSGIGVVGLFSLWQLIADPLWTANLLGGRFDLAHTASEVDLSYFLAAASLAAAMVLLGAFSRRHQRTVEELRLRNAELERLRRFEAEQALAAERTRIAREIHDVVAHHISAVVVRAQAASRVAQRDPSEAVKAVGWIADTGRDALTAMRQTVRVLRGADARTSAELAPTPTLADVARMGDRLAEVGLVVHMDLPPSSRPLATAAELAAARIVQEALTNTLTHARATTAHVQWTVHNGQLVVAVDDNGTAGAPPPDGLPRSASGGGHGLIGMHERAAACGGSLYVSVGPLGGWRVQAWLPM